MLRRVLPRRLTLVEAVLWALRIGIVIFVVLGSYLTLFEGRLATSGWILLISSGLSQGAIYALIALGYTMVYGVLFMINFAHGEVFMMGSMVGMFTAMAMAAQGLLADSPFIAIGLIFVVAMLTSMCVAIALERIAYRPLRRAPRLVPLITAIGASLFLQYTAFGMFGPHARRYPPFELLQGRIEILGLSFQRIEVITIVACGVLMALLYWFVERTRTGRSMRAVSENKDTAALMGINVDRVIVTTFAVGGLLAGFAGVLYSFLFNRVSWDMGVLVGIKAFTAAVLGGIGNIVGAMLGGLALGVIENVGPSLLLTGFDVPAVHQLKDVLAFTVLILVLVFRPTGFLGRKENV